MRTGKWKLFLETPKHGTGHSLIIQRRRRTPFNIKNVAIGEVWLCAGQSNMGWSMGNSFEAEKEADVNLPNFRIFKSAREHWHTPLEMQRDRLSQWKLCNPGLGSGDLGRILLLRQEAAPGTRYSRRPYPTGLCRNADRRLDAVGDPEGRPARALHTSPSYDERACKDRVTMKKALADFEKELAEYNAKIDAGETMKNSVKPLSPPIITKPANLGHQYPGHQFNAMIHTRFVLTAFAAPSGTRVNATPRMFRRRSNYRKQLALLINYYRSSWHELSGGGVADDFPFQFTQLPSWTPEQTEPVEGHQKPRGRSTGK